jgi:hypothetical protein
LLCCGIKPNPLGYFAHLFLVQPLLQALLLLLGLSDGLLLLEGTELGSWISWHSSG